VTTPDKSRCKLQISWGTLMDFVAFGTSLFLIADQFSLHD
jgi:hypothetical protein